MAIRTRVAFLLFGSGFCALIYQTTWLREFRLIFGVSTAASAAVLGVFMAGIGVGGIILGRRSEIIKQPLAFYAKLELLIAATAALSPLAISVVRYLYIALGGTETMGTVSSMIVRLIVSTIIIGIPTFLMGGTLPAAAKSVVENNDVARRTVGILYGTNTLGAVVGALAGTFYFFENLGNRATLWLAAGLNVFIAIVAFRVSKATGNSETRIDSKPAAANTEFNSPLRSRFVLVAAGVVGFAFFLMELVWYRMLGPLLGGSTFSFGLILAVALLGIGFGGAAYAFLDLKRGVSLQLLALTISAEALFVGLPYALGDRIAMAAMLLRPFGTIGFYGHVLVWSELCLIVVFPAAVLAGLQFPLLIALLGHGRNRVGSQTGSAYAWNTTGALVGSLAGGFGLIPLFSAPGVWRLVIVLLCLLAAVAAFLALLERWTWKELIPSILIIALALSSLSAIGPTAFWRHSEIGVGSITKFAASPNELRDLVHMSRRKVMWEKDGIESSVALVDLNGLSFLVNGRSDGNAKDDAGTQIMLGLVGAAIHPNPTEAMVIGLGTGSTAGWLAAVPGIQKIDVVELEPAVRRVAQECADVNHNALLNPKLHLTIGDARELLLTTHEKYDLIASEPSNPYRSGVAGVFTREFYQSVDRCLRKDGIFCQWVQAYDIDDRTVQTIYRTLGQIFPNIESWQTEANDLLLVASREPLHYNLDQLRTRLSEEPFQTALHHAWQADGLEEFLAHYLGNQAVSTGLQISDIAQFNTDDRTVIEFGMARSVGRNNGFRIASLRAAAHSAHADRPKSFEGEVDWARVEEARLAMYVPLYPLPEMQSQLSPAERSRAAAFISYTEDDLPRAWQRWRSQTNEPQTLLQLELVAECLAAQGDSSALPYIQKLASLLPSDAEAIRARLLWAQGNSEAATEVLEKVFASLREDPWLPFGLTRRSLKLAGEIAGADSSNARAIAFFNALRAPFAIRNEEADRLTTLFNLGVRIDGTNPGEYTLRTIEILEPNVPWQYNFLHVRELCYSAMHNPKAEQAKRDLDEFIENEPMSVQDLTKQIQAASEKSREN